MGQIYIDRNKTYGIELAEQNIKEKIYDQYLQAFKQGVYSTIKEEIDPVTDELIPRKYFSGGIGVVTKVAQDTSGSPRTFGQTVIVQVQGKPQLVHFESSSSAVRNISIFALSLNVAAAFYPHYAGWEAIERTETAIIAATPEKVWNSIFTKEILQWRKDLGVVPTSVLSSGHPVVGVQNQWIFNNGPFGTPMTVNETPRIVQPPAEGNKVARYESDMKISSLTSMVLSETYILERLPDGTTKVTFINSLKPDLFKYWAADKSLLVFYYLGGGWKEPSAHFERLREYLELNRSSTPEAYSQAKPQPDNFTKGGIDFNAGNLDLKEQGRTFQWQIDPSMEQNLRDMDYDTLRGILPVITNISIQTKIMPLQKGAP